MVEQKKKQEEFFPITSLHREDIAMAFEGLPEEKEALAFSKKATDTDMKYIARKIAEAITDNDTYWLVIREYVGDELEKTR